MARQPDLLQASVAAFAEIERLQGLLSFHDPKSELSRLNREAQHRPVEVGPEMVEVLTFAQRLSQQSHAAFGADVFDLTVAAELVRRGALPDPGASTDDHASWRDVHLEGNRVRFGRPLLLDLGGIAKGYSVDRALAVIPETLESVVNAGGDLRMRSWQGRTATVEVPVRRGRPRLLDVPMRAAAVATSGSYRGDLGSTILCPTRHLAVQQPRSVSVFAPTCMVADALTKVASLVPDEVLATEGLPLLASHDATVLLAGFETQRWVGAA